MKAGKLHQSRMDSELGEVAEEAMDEYEAVKFAAMERHDREQLIQQQRR